MLHPAPFRFIKQTFRSVLPAIKVTEKAPTLDPTGVCHEENEPPIAAEHFPTTISHGPNKPCTVAVCGAAVMNFIEKERAKDSSLRFRLVPQASYVKFLYRVDRTDQPGTEWNEETECIPICLKTTPSIGRASLRYNFTFPSPTIGGLGFVLVGTQPDAVFMLPSDSIAGKRHTYIHRYDDPSDHLMKNPDVDVTNTLNRWWHEETIPRVKTASWASCLHRTTIATGELVDRRFALFHVIAQIEAMVQKSSGWTIDYTEAVREGQKYRGMLCNKEITFSLGTPVKSTGTEAPIYRATLRKRPRDVGDLVLVAPHRDGEFDRFYLFTRSFLCETAAKSDVLLTGYHIYPSNRMCRKAYQLQASQEKFEILCDQESLRILPEYEQKFKDILNGEIHLGAALRKSNVILTSSKTSQTPIVFVRKIPTVHR